MCMKSQVTYLKKESMIQSGIDVSSVFGEMLYHISTSTCIDAEFPATLKSLMLHDSDAQVVANCLAALQEIWSLEASHSEEKESLLSKPFIYYFFNRINEWPQCLILELAVKYLPSDSNDNFDIMNLLEDRPLHANGAVVLATVQVFLQLTLSINRYKSTSLFLIMENVSSRNKICVGFYDDTFVEIVSVVSKSVSHAVSLIPNDLVYERIKSPLLTLVSSGSPEQSYAILSHLHLLVVRAPFIFASDYKHFCCQYNEPLYVKKLKLEMLTAIANESKHLRNWYCFILYGIWNEKAVLTELCEYAANVDIEIARESIRAVGKIALQQYDVNAIALQQY
ncbi:LOW QUALITY PROTEIN: hypothetical protein HID58_050724 [Brassica napus]|uniref:Condensin complex subunit 1 C-terminal domain-containing protein n=1 Tax=Brassica napus TaxID=3708 RepID=A0ABQ8A8C1_BRANA|nr:LOW QUALITY PROTEIN: hypothetical protein HID58_050724 [Brassica napus]